MHSHRRETAVELVEVVLPGGDYDIGRAAYLHSRIVGSVLEISASCHEIVE